MSIRTELDRIIDEVVTQSDLLDQALTALQGKVAASGEDVTAETDEYTELLTDLEAAVDSLPDAGSGGTPETCTVTFEIRDSYANPSVYATTTAGNIYVQESATIDVLKNSMVVLYIMLPKYSPTVSGGLNIIAGDTGTTYAYTVTEDGTIAVA